MFYVANLKKSYPIATELEMASVKPMYLSSAMGEIWQRRMDGGGSVEVAEKVASALTTGISRALDYLSRDRTGYCIKRPSPSHDVRARGA